MKRSAGLSRLSRQAKALENLEKRGWRRRKTWTFEQLEDRQYFSATPLEFATVSMSSATPEGAYYHLLRELEAFAQQSASASNIPMSTMALPTDPYFLNQWHLWNTGQEVGNPDYQTIYGTFGEDINVVGAWNLGYTGEGVIVAVLDSGTEMTHPDLIGNIHPILRWDALDNDPDPNPRFNDPGTAHGTAVAGLIGAVADNGLGGVGVAPGVQLVPIRLIDGGQTERAFIDAFRYATDQIDVTNNSWGPGLTRVALGPSPDELLALRDSIIFGRDGKGIIHVFASGNGAGPSFSDGFQSIGNYGSSSYDGWVNTRYTIGVTGVDHDGLYANVDGTFTAYPEISPSVLIAAPTGSNAALAVGDDDGLGSGIWTTDLTGDNGYNMGPLPSGQELDRDFLDDPDYTARFNGTSAAAPIATGVIALMLEANPDLTWRDVQEILVRSARQNAEFETPSSGGGLGSINTWQMNQNPIFRNPDPWESTEEEPQDPFLSVYFPQVTPFFPSDTQRFTNGAGYTVSQGYGVYSEATGYAHGVVDAELAVKMARDWDTYNQWLRPELTFSTFVLQPGANIPASVKLSQDAGYLHVPGAIGGQGGYEEYWEEYFVDDDPDDPEDGPFSDYDGPGPGQRGTPFLEFSVPDDNAMQIEHVEVKVDITGDSSKLDFLRIMLMSPEGTVSELNHYYHDPAFGAPISHQSMSGASSHIDPNLDIDFDGDGRFVWTFSTNRNWGERSSDALIVDPLTNEPTGGTRGWRLYIENWSDTDFVLEGLEVVWHGEPIVENTQRIQGFIGIDDGLFNPNDGQFNYSRVNTILSEIDDDPEVTRLHELQNILDVTRESFASNIVVAAYRVVDGVVDPQPTDQFLVGADGNYYLDLVPDEYVIRMLDPETGEIINGLNHDNGEFLPHYQSEWHITADWFVAHDHTEPDPAAPFRTTEVMADEFGNPVPHPEFGEMPTGIKNINFLLEPSRALSDEVIISGTVYADMNANGLLDGVDTGAGEFVVYHDANRNGALDPGEAKVQTSNGGAGQLPRGSYEISLPATAPGPFQLGVIRPNSSWDYTNPDSGLLTVVAEPGDIFENQNFFIQPPANSIPQSGIIAGNIIGFVYHDRDSDGVRGDGEEGVSGFQVYVDANGNEQFDEGEIQSVTDSRGAYFLANVPPGTVDVRIVAASPWSLTAPGSGVHQITLGSDGTVSNVRFGILDNATSDWGDLAGYPTLASEDGPRHTIVPGFHLGTKIDGEIDGQPTANADGDDAVTGDEDGVAIISNGGVLRVGSNTARVTVAGVGGLLQGWMDFNNDGDWNDAGEQIFVNVDLNPGTHDLLFQIPAGLAGGTIASRFRWGTPNLSYTGASPIGEVEDYRFESAAPISQLAGDYDIDGAVGDADYLVWKATLGSTNDLRADGNKNGVIDAADFTVWRDNYGAATAAAVGAYSYATVSNAPTSSPLFVPFDFSGMNSQFLARHGVSRITDYYESLGAWKLVTNRYVGSSTATGAVTSPTGIDAVPFAPSAGVAVDPVALASIGPLSAIQFAQTRTETGDPSPVASTATATNGLVDYALLDDAIARFAEEDADEFVGPLAFADGEERDEATYDLAMAAAFEQEDRWRMG